MTEALKESCSIIENNLLVEWWALFRTSTYYRVITVCSCTSDDDDIVANVLVRSSEISASRQSSLSP
jgi:hypothetical protein